MQTNTDPSTYPLPVVRGEVKERTLVIATQLLTGLLATVRQNCQYRAALPLLPQTLISVTPRVHLSLSKGEG
jgi:hypothetical protein